METSSKKLSHCLLKFISWDNFYLKNMQSSGRFKRNKTKKRHNNNFWWNLKHSLKLLKSSYSKKFWKIPDKFSVIEFLQWCSRHATCNLIQKKLAEKVILRMAIPHNTRDALRTLSSTYNGVFLQKFSIYFELVDVSYYKEVWLSLTKISECCESFRRFMANLIAYFEKIKERQPTITCPGSYTLVIRWLRFLKRKLL